MAISGGIKFLDENLCLSNNGGTIVASSGNSVASNAIDKFAWSYWQSNGSNDSTTETLTLTFPSCTFSRLLLLDHNFKSYTAKYWNGSSFVNFSSVFGLDPTGVNGNGVSLSNIGETAYADIASYYEFASVTTTQIQVTATLAQVTNAEKYLATIFIGNELGTFQGYPGVSFEFSKNDRQMQMLSGLMKLVKQNEFLTAKLKFDHYPFAYGADVDLLMTLFDRETPFHMWPCGGRRGSKYFGYQMRGFRLKDLYRVQMLSDITPEYTENIYTSGISGIEATLVQSV